MAPSNCMTVMGFSETRIYPHTPPDPHKLPASLVLQYEYTEMGEGDGL